MSPGPPRPLAGRALGRADCMACWSLAVLTPSDFARADAFGPPPGPPRICPWPCPGTLPWLEAPDDSSFLALATPRPVPASTTAAPPAAIAFRIFEFMCSSLHWGGDDGHRGPRPSEKAQGAEWDLAQRGTGRGTQMGPVTRTGSEGPWARAGARRRARCDSGASWTRRRAPWPGPAAERPESGTALYAGQGA